MKSKGSTTLLLCIIVLLAFGAVGAYTFLFSAMKNSNDRIAAYNEEIKRREEEKSRQDSLAKLIAEVEPTIAKIDSYYVAADGVVDFIERIEDLAATAGVKATISSVDVPSESQEAEEESEPSRTELVTLSVEFEGSWRNCMRFVSFIESLPYDVSVSRLGLSTNLEAVGTFGSSTRSSLNWTGGATLSVVKKK